MGECVIQQNIPNSIQKPLLKTILQRYLPSNDAASSPHQSNATHVQFPFHLFCRFPHQHKALCVGNDFRCIEGLKAKREKKAKLHI